MKKLIFLHGFFASGQCVPAMTLKEAFEGKAEVVTPDLPLHPKEALEYISELIGHEKPDVLVGNSCGSFYAQMIAPSAGIPALLGNPHFQMTAFLRPRIGAQRYKSPRKNGCQDFFIDEQLISEFAELEARQFADVQHDSVRDTPLYNKERVWGLFGDQDTLAHFEPLFLTYYSHSFHFPGGHTPTADEVFKWYVPLIEKLLQEWAN